MFNRISYNCTQLVKQQANSLSQKRYIPKQYLKHPKPFNMIPGTLEDLYFKFHCYGVNMTFDSKMNILQSMTMQPVKLRQLQLNGVQKIISSLTQELTSLNYSDTDEYNISQFINLLHKMQYYDNFSWIAAMDNYHKQGILNWYQYTEFTHAVYDFSQSLTETWHLNIVSDISQEAFSDFIGFLENKDTLDLCEKEINQAYQHLRRFKVKGTRNHMMAVLQYFMQSLKQPPVSLTTYQFVFYFCMDHVNVKELESVNRSLFYKLIQQLNIELREFEDLQKLVTKFDEYTLLIQVTLKYHEEVPPEIHDKFTQQILNLFEKGQLEDLAYSSLKNLNTLNKLLINQKCFKTVNEVIVMIEELSLMNLKNLKTKKQDLLSIFEIYERLEDQNQFLSVIAKANLVLEDVLFTNEELMVFLRKLDECDLVYYLSSFLESTLQYVAKNINDFQPDDWCFTFYLVYKYVVKDHEDQARFDPDLNILKQYIKLRYMTSYRQTIPTNSSYYKILSVVEIETFFADDLLNLY